MEELVLSSHQVESSLRGMKRTMVFNKGWLVKWGFHDKVTLSRDLGGVRRGQANRTSGGDSSGNGNRYALRWHCSAGLSVMFSFLARGKFLSSLPLPLSPPSLPVQFSTYFLEHLLCGGMGQMEGEVMCSTRPNIYPQGVHRWQERQSHTGHSLMAPAGTERAK